MVDIMIQANDEFLARNGIAKGTMALVNEQEVDALYKQAGAAVEMASGGSAANTLSGFASLGGNCAFMGKVGLDQFGAAFTHDLKAQNIAFSTPPSQSMATGRCLVFVTPDAQRSMCTYLGAAAEFSTNDLDIETIQSSDILYMEGYLFDKPTAQNAFIEAAKTAKAAGRKVALSLSDAFCVSRHREAFITLIENSVDILFANEGEACSLYETEDISSAVASLRGKTEIAVITRGAEGAIALQGENSHNIAAHPPSRITDTTGAGDLFAAGFLYGLTHGKPLPECGRTGAIAAAEVISHFGPRPQTPLKYII